MWLWRERLYSRFAVKPQPDTPETQLLDLLSVADVAVRVLSSLPPAARLDARAACQRLRAICDARLSTVRFAQPGPPGSPCRGLPFEQLPLLAERFPTATIVIIYTDTTPNRPPGSSALTTLKHPQLGGGGSEDLRALAQQLAFVPDGAWSRVASIRLVSTPDSTAAAPAAAPPHVALPGWLAARLARACPELRSPPAVLVAGSGAGGGPSEVCGLHELRRAADTLPHLDLSAPPRAAPAAALAHALSRLTTLERLSWLPAGAGSGGCGAGAAFGSEEPVAALAAALPALSRLTRLEAALLGRGLPSLINLEARIPEADAASNYCKSGSGGDEWCPDGSQLGAERRLFYAVLGCAGLRELRLHGDACAAAWGEYRTAWGVRLEALAALELRGTLEDSFDDASGAIHIPEKLLLDPPKLYAIADACPNLQSLSVRGLIVSLSAIAGGVHGVLPRLVALELGRPLAAAAAGQLARLAPRLRALAVPEGFRERGGCSALQGHEHLQQLVLDWPEPRPPSRTAAAAARRRRRPPAGDRNGALLCRWRAALACFEASAAAAPTVRALACRLAGRFEAQSVDWAAPPLPTQVFEPGFTGDSDNSQWVPDAYARPSTSNAHEGAAASPKVLAAEAWGCLESLTLNLDGPLGPLLCAAAARAPNLRHLALERPELLPGRQPAARAALAGLRQLPRLESLRLDLTAHAASGGPVAAGDLRALLAQLAGVRPAGLAGVSLVLPRAAAAGVGWAAMEPLVLANPGLRFEFLNA